MKIVDYISLVQSGSLDETLIHLYGQDKLNRQKERYLSVLANAKEVLHDADVRMFSAPGRTEVGGNHTDHQLGRVIAAPIDLDVLAVVEKTDTLTIAYYSDAFQVKPVSLNSLQIDESEKNTTESLIRGIASKIKELGYEIGGFNVYAESDVLPGGGMSSSAAFEILIADIISRLYNDGAIDSVTEAKIGQYAENVYFGKASGLLDQMACSVGGFVTIDFKDRENPVVQQVPFDFDASGYALILTDCKQSHADLSDEYSLVPGEMKEVAHVFGKEVLSEITLEEFISNTAVIRSKCSDRAYLRAFHFLKETDRVVDEVNALKDGNMQQFLTLIKESGRSSYMYLQNVCPPGDTKHMSLAVALALSENYLGKDGAWRVHGGGFAGTIQAFVKQEQVAGYIALMESVFGKGCCYKLKIRDVGGTEIK